MNVFNIRYKIFIFLLMDSSCRLFNKIIQSDSPSFQILIFKIYKYNQELF